jgi:hypothetical protein
MNRITLIPSNKNNSCPICDNTSGKCRQSREDQDYWQCMTYADAKKGDIISGYKCLGHLKDGLWDQFRIDNSQEWSEQQRQEWQARNQQPQEQQAKSDQIKRLYTGKLPTGILKKYFQIEKGGKQ